MEILFGLLLSLQIFTGDLSSFSPEDGCWRSNHTVANSNFGFSWNYRLPARDFEYDFHFQLSHSTSSTNYTEFRLFHFQADSFLLRVGNAQDKLLIIRKNLSSEKVLIASIDGRSQLSSSNNIFRIKIRYQNQRLSLLSQINNENEFKTDGYVDIDLDGLGNNQNAAIRVFQSTASFFGKHRFFWWKVNPIFPDLSGPKLSSYHYDKQKLSLIFDEDLRIDSLEVFVNQNSVAWDSLVRNILYFDMAKIPSGMLNFQLFNLADSLSNINNLDTNLLVYFPVYGDVIINEIFPDPSPVYFMPNAEFLEIKNMSAYPINLKDVTLNDDRSSYYLPDFELKAFDYALLFDHRDSALFKTFRNLVPLDKWVSLTNSGKFLSLSSKYGDILDSVRYDWNWVKDNNKYLGGFSLERVNSYPNCLKPSDNWQVCPLAWGGTPGFKNASAQDFQDKYAPKISSLSVDYYKNVKLVFDEFLFSVDSLQLNNKPIFDFYIRDNFIEFKHSETASNDWIIGVYGVKDCLGNSDSLSVFNYKFNNSEIPKRGDILISEFLADAFPVRKLPDTEYVELFNKSDKYLYLGGTKICRDNNCAVLPDFYMEPNSYVILCDYFAEHKFETAIEVIPVINFPDLLSGGASIFYRNQEGLLLDKVLYHSSWYKDAFKRDGGFSLERSSFNDFCAEDFIESQDPMGGSPGLANSVQEIKLKDFSRTDALKVMIIHSRIAVLEMDHACNEFGLEHIQILPEHAQVIRVEADSNDMGKFYLYFDSDLSLNQSYNLLIDSFFNCAGLMVSYEFKMVHCKHPKTEQILINEILFNPKTGFNDYVELFNNSMDYLNLYGLYLANSDDLFGLAKDKVVINKNYCLEPGSYVLLGDDFSNASPNYKNVIQERLIPMSLISMPDDKGIIQVYDSNFNLLDAFSYSEKMHHFLIKDREGKALEKVNPRSISYASDALWVSASSENNFGSPTRENSQMFDGQNIPASVLNVWPLGISPDNNGYRDFMEIIVKGPEADFYVKAEIINVLGQVIYDFGGVKLLGNELKLLWEGQDKWGNRVNNGHYFIRVELVKGEKSIREIKTIAVGE